MIIRIFLEGIFQLDCRKFGGSTFYALSGARPSLDTALQESENDDEIVAGFARIRIERVTSEFLRIQLRQELVEERCYGPTPPRSCILFCACGRSRSHIWIACGSKDDSRRSLLRRLVGRRLARRRGRGDALLRVDASHALDLVRGAGPRSLRHGDSLFQSRLAVATSNEGVCVAL